MELSNIQFDNTLHPFRDDRSAASFPNFRMLDVVPDRSSDREEEDFTHPIWKKPLWADFFGGHFSA